MDITMEIAKSLISQGPLVGLLFWLLIQNKDEIKKKDHSNSELNKELRNFMEGQLNKTHELTVKTNETVAGNTMAVNSLKEVIRDARS